MTDSDRSRSDWPENRIILRGYTVQKIHPLTASATAITIWDLQVDYFPINHFWQEYFEVERRCQAPIIYFNRAENDVVQKFQIGHRYTGDEVFKIVEGSLSKRVYETVDPYLLQSLDRRQYNDEQLTEMLEQEHVVLVGELLPENQGARAPVHAILKQAHLLEYIHHDQPPPSKDAPEELQEQHRKRFCSFYNCPICEPLQYTYEVVEKSNHLTDYVILGEPYNSQRSLDGDEYMYLKGTAEVLKLTGVLLQSASILSDLSMMQMTTTPTEANTETIKRMEVDYQRLIEMMYDDKEEKQ